MNETNILPLAKPGMWKSQYLRKVSTNFLACQTKTPSALKTSKSSKLHAWFHPRKHISARPEPKLMKRKVETFQFKQEMKMHTLDWLAIFQTICNSQLLRYRPTYSFAKGVKRFTNLTKTHRVSTGYRRAADMYWWLSEGKAVLVS